MNTKLKQKNWTKILKKAQDSSSDLNSQITLKDSQNQMLSSELDENKLKLDDFNKEKRSLEGKSREYTEGL